MRKLWAAAFQPQGECTIGKKYFRLLYAGILLDLCVTGVYLGLTGVYRKVRGGERKGEEMEDLSIRRIIVNFAGNQDLQGIWICIALLFEIIIYHG